MNIEIGGDNHGPITQSRTINIIFTGNGNKRPNVVPCLIAVFLLCVASFVEEPYVFTFLRIVTCGAFAYVFFYIRDSGLKFIVAIFMILYNPFWPICLDCRAWDIANIVTALFLVALYSFLIVKAKMQTEKAKLDFQEEENNGEQIGQDYG